MGRARLVSQPSRIVFCAVAILYVCAFVFAITLLSRYGGLSKDAGWTWRSAGGATAVETVNARGPAAPIVVGARVIAINGDRRAAQAGPRPWLNAVKPGESYRISWVAPGSSQVLESTLVMGSRESRADLMMGLCDLFLSLCFCGAGLLVWWSKPSGAVARPCYVAAMLMAFFLIASALGPISPLLSGLPAGIYIVIRSIFPFYLTAGCAFFAVFPTGEMPRGWWRNGLRALWFGGAIVWAVVLWLRLLPFLGLEWRLMVLSGLDLNTRPELGLLPLRHGYAAMCGLFLFAVAVHNYRRLENAAMRLRIRWVILGATVGIAPAVLSSIALALAPRHVGNLLVYYSLPTLTMAAVPAAVAYAVVCHRLMGIRVALLTGMHLLAARRVLRVLSLAPAALACVYVWRHRQLGIMELWQQHPAAVVMIAASGVLALFRKEVLELADRLLLRLPYDRDRVVGGLLETLLRQDSAEGIALAAATRIEPALQPERLLVYCAASESSDMRFVYGSQRDDVPQTIATDSELAGVLKAGPLFVRRKSHSGMSELDREWLTGSDIVLAVPVAAAERSQPAGILFLGRKRSGEAYTATDVDVLDDIARQVYLALKLRELETSRDVAIRAREQAENVGESKTQFLAQVSHELRNPLHGVVGLTGLLLDTPLSEEQQEYAELIRRSSEWMVTIANDLLDFTKVEAGKLKLDTIEFEWTPLLEDVVSIAAQRARRKDVEVIVEVDPSTPAVSAGDPTRVRQVLLNLLDNAVKFTDRGWVRLRSSGAPGGIRIEVKDTGPGISEEMRSRLFEPYQQGSAAAVRRGGTGLGLAISNRLVAAMGGALTCESRPGNGTSFELVLPAGSAGAESQPAADAPLENVRVLCIDSLAVGAQALYFTLMGMGARVATRADELPLQGSDAPGVRFDVVLFSAPFNARGVSCAVRNIRRAEGNTPIIVLYHGAPPLAPREARLLGPLEQIRKPAIRKTLLRGIQKALATKPAEPARREQVEGTCAGIRVLLVEDDPATARISEMMLNRLGCNVFITSTGRQALQSIKTVAFDIALIDGKLPDIHGLDLTQCIRGMDTERSTTPIVVLSGDASQDSRKRFFEAGADDYVLKPVTVEELRDVIRLRANQNHAGTA
jgi:signal transduction histidine kinase/CheY-like chemotaxis protein